jgi:hypothetical protein
MESAPITPSLTQSVSARGEMPPTSSTLTHTLNVFGELGMFVDPTKCTCTTCVEYCKSGRKQECWGCGTKFDPKDHIEKYCTKECEWEDHARMQEDRACCTGCCHDYDHQEFQQDCEDETQSEDYPSEDDEEPNCCVNCGDEFYGKGYFCSSLCEIKRPKFVKSGAVPYDSAEDD